MEAVSLGRYVHGAYEQQDSDTFTSQDPDPSSEHLLDGSSKPHSTDTIQQPPTKRPPASRASHHHEFPHFRLQAPSSIPAIYTRAFCQEKDPIANRIQAHVSEQFDRQLGR